MTEHPDNFDMDSIDDLLEDFLPSPPIPNSALPVLFAAPAAPPRVMELNVIYALTPEEILQLSSANRKTSEGGRMSWPFKDMAVHDRVCISAALAGKGQTAVHVYAARTDKRFVTARQPNKNLVVTRIS